eukprot:1183113-Prorocentrum_minimum.AAC.2
MCPPTVKPYQAKLVTMMPSDSKVVSWPTKSRPLVLFENRSRPSSSSRGPCADRIRQMNVSPTVRDSSRPLRTDPARASAQVRLILRFSDRLRIVRSVGVRFYYPADDRSRFSRRFGCELGPPRPPCTPPAPRRKTFRGPNRLARDGTDDTNDGCRLLTP